MLVGDSSSVLDSLDVVFESTGAALGCWPAPSGVRMWDSADVGVVGSGFVTSGDYGSNHQRLNE